MEYWILELGNGERETGEIFRNNAGCCVGVWGRESRNRNRLIFVGGHFFVSKRVKDERKALYLSKLNLQTTSDRLIYFHVLFARI